MPWTCTLLHTGTWASPCSPSMKPLTRCRRTPNAAAISRRKRSVSEYAPIPITRLRPMASAKYATPSSTGLVTTITISVPWPYFANASA